MPFACPASIRSIEPRKAGAALETVSFGEALATDAVIVSAATNVAARRVLVLTNRGGQT